MKEVIYCLSLVEETTRYGKKKCSHPPTQCVQPNSIEYLICSFPFLSFMGIRSAFGIKQV